MGYTETKDFKKFFNALDIAYIKQNYRYAVGNSFFLKKIIFALFIFLCAIVLSIYLLFWESGTSDTIKNCILSIPLVIISGTYFIRLLLSFNFFVVNNTNTKESNVDIITDFLKSKNINYQYRGDIIYVISRNLYSGEKVRECIVFIIDDNSILINNIILDNNIINVGWVTPYSRHFQQLKSELARFIV